MENTDETKGKRRNFRTVLVRVLLLLGLILYLLRVEAALLDSARKEDMARLVMDLTDDVATVNDIWLLNDSIGQLEGEIQRIDGYLRDVPTLDDVWLLEDRVIEIEDAVHSIGEYVEELAHYDDVWPLEDRIIEVEGAIQDILEALEETRLEE